MKSTAEMETIMNLTYPGLRLLSRDANLRIAEGNYAPGMLLRAHGATEASLMMGGLQGMHRFAILSNNFRKVMDDERGAEWALCAIRPGAHFKVLDVYRRLGKTQITLLHLPEAHWKFFEEISTNVDDLLVEYTRKRFDACIDAEPIEALDDPEWRKRCCHPVGMTDLGQVLPLTDGE